MEEKKVLVTAKEVADLFQRQYKMLGDITTCCDILQEDATGEKATCVSVIKETVEQMQSELTTLIYMFDEPEEKELHL